jgi:hypothetical protein
MPRTRRPRRFWSAAEVATLRALYPDTPTWQLARRFRRARNKIYAKANQLGLHKSATYLAGPHACRLRRGDNVDAAYRFKPGHVPANKGLRRPGWGPGRMKETQFKKGNYSKRWDRDAYCVGALRVNTAGGLDIKVKEGLRAWEPMTRYTWRTERGPIPRDGVVRVRNGDPHDTRIENLRLATRREVMRENSLHNYPKPLADAIQLRGALNRRINHLGERHAENQNA